MEKMVGRVTKITWNMRRTKISRYVIETEKTNMGKMEDCGS